MLSKIFFLFTSFECCLAHNLICSIEDGNPVKKAVLALGYVDFDYIKEKAKQADEGKSADGNEERID